MADPDLGRQQVAGLTLRQNSARGCLVPASMALRQAVPPPRAQARRQTDLTDASGVASRIGNPVRVWSSGCCVPRPDRIRTSPPRRTTSATAKPGGSRSTTRPAGMGPRIGRHTLSRSSPRRSWLQYTTVAATTSCRNAPGSTNALSWCSGSAKAKIVALGASRAFGARDRPAARALAHEKRRRRAVSTTAPRRSRHHRRRFRQQRGFLVVNRWPRGSRQPRLC